MLVFSLLFLDIKLKSQYFLVTLTQLSLDGCKIHTIPNLLKEYVYKPSVSGLKHGVCS